MQGMKCTIPLPAKDLRAPPGRDKRPKNPRDPRPDVQISSRYREARISRPGHDLGDLRATLRPENRSKTREKPSHPDCAPGQDTRKARLRPRIPGISRVSHSVAYSSHRQDSNRRSLTQSLRRQRVVNHENPGEAEWVGHVSARIRPLALHPIATPRPAIFPRSREWVISPDPGIDGVVVRLEQRLIIATPGEEIMRKSTRNPTPRTNPPRAGSGRGSKGGRSGAGDTFAASSPRPDRRPCPAGRTDRRLRPNPRAGDPRGFPRGFLCANLIASSRGLPPSLQPRPSHAPAWNCHVQYRQGLGPGYDPQAAGGAQVRGRGASHDACAWRGGRALGREAPRGPQEVRGFARRAGRTGQHLRISVGQPRRGPQEHRRDQGIRPPGA